MKSWLAAIVCAVAAVNPSAGRADDPKVRRLTVELDWRHMPRMEYRGEIATSRQRALVPGAHVRYTRWQAGNRTFTIEFDDGVTCSINAEAKAVAALDCGTNTAFYSLFQAPGRQSTLEWVTIGEQVRNVEQN